jgi:predicted nucleic acid-binding protein
MTDKVFIDSNVWCYLFVRDEREKYKIAEKFISKKTDNSVFVLSYQVINEVTNKLIQKNLKVKQLKKCTMYV